MAYPQKALIQTKLHPGSFCAVKRDLVWENTLLYQLEVLKSTGRYEAFKLKHHPSYNDAPDHWPVPNHLFWDSDVAKWIEGACYFLHTQNNTEVEKAVEELCTMIVSAQQPDGYLNIHYTVVDPGNRFTNLRDMHELYNAGHLIEAAVAHQHLHAQSPFFDAMVRYVDLFCTTFGPGEDQVHGYPGHPEIELALLRLFEVTRNKKHYDLAKYFIDERGNPTGVDGRHFYLVEAENRHESEYKRPNNWPTSGSLWYHQAHKPIVEQDTIQGHSVRAMYLLCAVADLQRLDKGSGYQEALQTLWSNMVEKKMYMTGGIGAIKQWEGFGIDYFLPQGADEGGCYAETCASIGIMMLAERLLQIDLNRYYSDTMELAFYNTVLGGMNCTGKEFTYVNQLASSDEDPDRRQKWFTCACCPPNVTRTFGFLGGYLWSFQVHEASVTIQVHLFDSADLVFEVGEEQVRLRQESKWPWQREVKFRLEAPESVETTISIRIPEWATGWTMDPKPENAKLTKGYLQLSADWTRANPNFELNIPMIVRKISPHPYTNQNVVALARGPLVYCLEDVDNPWVDDHFKSLLFEPSATITESERTDSSTGETYIMLTASGPFHFLDTAKPDATCIESKTNKADQPKTSRSVDQLHFIPYYYRGNRDGKGHMRVGIRKA